MIIRDCLNKTFHILTENSIDDAWLESEVLVRHILNYDRVMLYQNIEQKFPSDKLSTLESVINRRIKGEPSAYITNHKEFYGLEFYVNSDVLIPRPRQSIWLKKPCL